MPYIVRFRNRYDGCPVYLGGPGLCVNTGVRKSTSSVMRADDAKRFTKYATAKRRSYDCNPQWYGEVLEVDE